VLAEVLGLADDERGRAGGCQLPEQDPVQALCKRRKEIPLANL
jgi:hypothetical protein